MSRQLSIDDGYFAYYTFFTFTCCYFHHIDTTYYTFSVSVKTVPFVLSVVGSAFIYQ